MGPSTENNWHDAKRGNFTKSSTRSKQLTKTCTVRTCSKASYSSTKEMASTSTAKPIVKSTDPLCIRNTKDFREVSSAKGVVRSTKERRFTSRSSALICTCSWWKILVRCCLREDQAMSWLTFLCGNKDAIPN